MTKNKKTQTLTDFANIEHNKDKTFIYIAALLCVGHTGIHTHLFQRNLVIGYKKAYAIRNDLKTLGLLKKDYPRLLNLSYLVEEEKLKKFIEYCLDSKQSSLSLDKVLIEAGKEALKMFDPKKWKNIKTPYQDTDVEAIVQSPMLWKYLKKHYKVI